MGQKNSTASSSNGANAPSSLASSLSLSFSALTSHTPDRCEWCGHTTHHGLKKTGELLQCKRCHGIVPRTKHRGQHVHEEKSDGQSSQAPLPLRLIHLVPFAETLPDDNAVTEQSLLDEYLVPFFATKHGMVVTANQRYQINSIDFKVLSCFPPRGYVSENTKFRCLSQPLHALSRLAKLHVLPTQASLPHANMSSQTIFHDYLKPYFAPPAPSQSQSPSNDSNNPNHHLSLGDTFMSRGVQFKVVAAYPNDGVVTRETDIFPDGEPIADIVKLHILPIYESLPNNEKNISPELCLEKYLYPYFSGKFVLIHRGDQLEIDGVTFRVQACEPDTGIVTMETEIYTAGEPLRAENLRRQQEEQDAQMALRLQQQEARENGYIPPSMPLASMPMGGPMLGGPHGPIMFGSPMMPFMMPPNANRPLSASTPDELRQRLQDMLRMMPEHDARRLLIRRLLDSLPQNQGATKRDIECLPTRVFHSKPKTETAGVTDQKSDESAKEQNQCMVCLCEYEDDETLRTLPCFHSYHQACIDEWLGRNKQCPVCKHPITS